MTASIQFNKNATTLSPSQLAEWVFNELNKPSVYTPIPSLHDRIRFLMASGADPAWTLDMRSDGMRGTETHFSLAWAAANKLDVESLKILAEYNVKLDTIDHFGATPLATALQYAEDPSAVQRVMDVALFLISKNTDVQTKTPIVESAWAGLTEVVEALIQRGADLNANNFRRVSALAAAVFKGRLDIAKILINAGADINWISLGSGENLIKIAEELAEKCGPTSNQAEILKALKEAAADQASKPKAPQPKL